jgi:hypoxanthine phosphoribosyltransferase
MSQNEHVVPMSPADFEMYCERLAHQILDSGVGYDFVIVLEKGANHVWTYLREVLNYSTVIHVTVSRYPDGETKSRQPPEFGSFPAKLYGRVLIVDDCVDDADTMFETITRTLLAGAELVHSAVVLIKPENVKIKDPDTNERWHPTFAAWVDAPGNIYVDFPREAFKKRIEAARRQQAISS